MRRAYHPHRILAPHPGAHGPSNMLPHRFAHRAPAVLALCLGLLVACKRDKPAAPAPTPPEVLVARDIAAALFDAERITEAEAALAPLVERKPVDPADLVALAIAKLAGPMDRANVDEVVGLLERALALDPNSAAAHFNLGRVRFGWGTEWERALTSFRRAHELAPNDVPTAVFLAQLLLNVGRDNDDDTLLREAAELLTGVRTLGLELAGSWYMTALYVSWDLYGDLDRRDEGAAFLAELRTLEARGIPKPTPTDIQRGNLGRLRPPTPERAAPLQLATPRLGPPIALSGAALTGPVRDLRIATLRAEWREVMAEELEVGVPAGRNPETFVAGGEAGPAGVLASDGQHIVHFAPAEPGAAAWPGRVVLEAQHTAWLAIDVDPDWEGRTRTDPGVSALELLRIDAAGDLWVHRADGGGAFDAGRVRAPAGAGATALIAVDLDHEGDLDLVVAGTAAQADANGARLLRADGGGADVDLDRFTLAGEGWPLPAGRAFEWVIAEDFDGDDDSDLMLGGPQGLVWLDSLRRDRFNDRSADLPAGVDASRAPLAGDLDGDGFVDLWFPATGERLVGRFGERFERVAARAPIAVPAASTPVLVDFDLDGSLDVLWVTGTGQLGGVLAIARDAERELSPIELGARPGPLLIADVDGDQRLEVVYVDTSGAPAARAVLGEGRGLRLALRGVKDSARAIGAKIEVRAGALYRRLHFEGEPVLVGLGRAAAADVVRVTWTNGVVQTMLDAPAQETRVLEQIEGLIGSCPFLYVWNGTTFEFVTDVLGITPLGLPMAPDMLVPPDSDEYVLIRGEQFAPSDGEYVVQITEELREVTYLDQARLHVIDHPEGTELFPNERFTFPPFPVHELHLVRAPLVPLKALDQDGRDWAAQLAAEDGAFAIPFNAERGQFMGLATPHFLELSFDPAAVAQAERLRLVMCGWFYWTDASVNMAAARHPEVEFVPPLVEVPDGKGGWRSIGPSIGFPAGKLKTMVIEADGWLDRADPRLRIHSSLRLYWDAIRLATCAGDHARREHVLPASLAQLWERGFSGTVWLHAEERLEWFDWDVLAAVPRWNQHPGMYTRHGDVRTLLDTIDDQFVIFGAGDALELRFDAKDLPAVPEGWRRDYLLFLDGWAKDRDHNTEEALFVEPLPFHGMSGYPYGPDESYPDTAATREYRARYNVRGSKQWIEPLSPAASVWPRTADGK